MVKRGTWVTPIFGEPGEEKRGDEQPMKQPDRQIGKKQKHHQQPSAHYKAVGSRLKITRQKFMGDGEETNRRGAETQGEDL